MTDFLRDHEFRVRMIEQNRDEELFPILVRHCHIAHVHGLS